MAKGLGLTVLLALLPAALGQLNTAARVAGKKYFGTATNEFQFSDAPYLAELNNTQDFGQLTPANAMKWELTELVQGQFTFENASLVVEQARNHGQLLRGHTCVWHTQLPSWVSTGGFDKKTLLSVVDKHCSTVVGHFKGQMYSWDVVNEPFNEDGTFRETVFYNTTGTDYIESALRAAHHADPQTKLYINDYNIDGTGPKSDAMYNLVKSLKKKGVPIHGIGVQGHLVVGTVPTTIEENFRKFASLGVEIAITELDIRMETPATEALLAQQKEDYKTVISACKNVPACIGVTVWDWTDKYSWIPGVFPTEGAALPWDENLEKKPAYYGTLEAFLGH
ncbi:glycoside hydrolase family 10 protein [Macrolepiota fuliginosa MF-IS2]|uniref:Beta-xylanase n=1 Tax=Macrolepiota fuliginosa MF-IS2 TaxID=1400762 RepID=A0A9P6C5S1_9AGAR|nr:glycoside hydrolase family 10 protein [Macrolepiota fuliginosa MF-IS2]